MIQTSMQTTSYRLQQPHTKAVLSYDHPHKRQFFIVFIHMVGSIRFHINGYLLFEQKNVVAQYKK